MTKLAARRTPNASADEAVSLSAIEQVFGLSLPTARERYGRLTRREVQVAGLMASGKANRDIAEELGISPKTLDIHRANVMHKLLARTTAQVANLVNLLRILGDVEALAS